MSWARVDDGWWCHPKVMGLSLQARGLWVSALSWSCAQRRAIVPPQYLTMVGAGLEVAAELVTAGLWLEHPDGWQIHDWSEYQEQSLSEKRAAAGRKGGEAKAKKAPDQPQRKQTPSKTDLPDMANGLAGTHPYPSLPDPSKSSSSDSSSEEPPGTPDPAPAAAADEQTIRKTAYLVGRAAVPPTAANPDAYAAGTTKAILTGPDPTDRDRIRQALTDGATPEAIAAMWRPTAVDVARQTTPPPAARPTCLPCDNNGVLLDDQAVAHRCPVCNGGTRTDLIPAPTLTAVP